MSIGWKDAAVSAALDNLRAKPDAAALLESIDSEYLVVAFLDSFNMNVDKALAALRKTAEWRQSSGVAAYRKRIVDEKLEPTAFPHWATLSKHLPLCEGGKAIDKRGLPYGIICLGMIDANKIFEDLTEAEWVVTQFYFAEYRLLKCEEYARREGVLGNIALVQDLTSQDGLVSMFKKQRGKTGHMVRVANLVDLHYPGLIGQIFFAHAPWALDAIVAVVKPLMPKRMSQKIMIYPENKVSRLLEVIEPKSLPRFLGGDGEDADFVSTRKVVKGSTGTELVVAARAKDERGLWLSEGDVASYGFSVDGGYDIMLGCRFESDGETIEVRPPFRVDADSGGNSFEAPRRGRLVLVFDNTYSWVNGKTLRYEFSVIPAGTDSTTDDVTKDASDDKKGGYEAAAVPEAPPASS